jgi:hypothetical protein
MATALGGCEPDPARPREPAQSIAAPSPHPERILRLVLRLTPGGVETVRAVEAPGRINRRDPHRASPTFFRAVDRDERVLFERGFRLETHVRSETHGPEGDIEGRWIELAQPVFSVVVPSFEDLHAIRFFRGSRGDLGKPAELLGEVRP